MVSILLFKKNFGKKNITHLEEEEEALLVCARSFFVLLKKKKKGQQKRERPPRKKTFHIYKYRESAFAAVVRVDKSTL